MGKKNKWVVPFVVMALAVSPTVSAEQPARGVTYEVEDVTGPKRVQSLTVSAGTGRWVTTKARDKVLATETIPSQAKRYVDKGNRVVAAINGDMYRVATGLPIGLQIQGNRALVSHTVKESALKFPSFTVGGSGRPEIGSYAMIGTFTGDGNPLTIHSLNRNESLNNRIGLFTRAHNASGRLAILDPENAFIGDGALVVLEADAPVDLPLGGTIEARVKTVYPSYESGVEIPENGVVLAAFGTMRERLLFSALEGEEVSFRFDLRDMTTLALRNDVKEAISSYNWLVRAGQAQTLAQLSEQHDKYVMTALKARTAIGLKSDGTVKILSVDQGKSFSRGMTMMELATRIRDEGVVDAIALDGGGSTELMVRREGVLGLATVNYPADGRSRSVTNGLLLTSTVHPTGIAERIQVSGTETMYIGEKRTLGVKLVDTAGEPIDPRTKTFRLSNSGTASGLTLAAPLKPGTWRGTLAVDSARKTVTIPVTDRLTSLSVNAGQTLLLKHGETRKLTLSAKVGTRTVTVPSSAVSWSAGSGLTVKDGLVTALKSSGTSKVTVSAGGKMAELPVLIGKTSEVIDSFEKGKYGATSPYVSSYRVELSDKVKKSGMKSMAFIYSYSGWKSANGAMYVKSPGWVIKYPARSISLDVYGDKKAPWLRAVVRDAAGKAHTVDFVRRVDWSGWKTVNAKLDPAWKAPLRVESIYFVETDAKKRGKSGESRVYLDRLNVQY